MTRGWPAVKYDGLKKGDLDGDGVLSVPDIDHVLTLKAPLTP